MLLESVTIPLINSFVHYCTWKFKFVSHISYRTHVDSLWVWVHLGGVRVRVHKTRVRVHSAWVRVHRGGVRVRVHKGRVQVRTRVRTRTRTRTHPLSPSPSPDSLQHWTLFNASSVQPSTTALNTNSPSYTTQAFTMLPFIPVVPPRLIAIPNE